LLNKSSLLLIVCALGLAACQTTSPNIGKGPITLSPSATANFENYKSKDDPTYFIVANDGSTSGYNYCGPTDLNCYDDFGAGMLSRCTEEAKARGIGCSIFAIGQKIVWDGSVSYRGHKDDYSVILIIAKSSSYDENSFNIYNGIGMASSTRNAIELKFRNCSGEVNLLTGKWLISGCSKFYSAKGKIEAVAGELRYRGFGKDNKGRIAEIKLIKTTGQTTRQKPSQTIRQRQGFFARVYPSALCQFALSAGSPPKWDAERAEYVSEAKRRGFSVRDCLKHAGRTVAETKPKTKPLQAEQKFITPAPSSLEKSTVRKPDKPQDKTIEARLKKLQGLVEKGLITEDEAAKKRQAILEGL
jgi:hypothetical protein